MTGTAATVPHLSDGQPFPASTVAPDGTVSSGGAIGRLVADDVAGLVRHVASQA